MSAVGNALKDVEEKSKATKNELKTLEKALKLDPQKLGEAKASTENLIRQIESIRDHLKDKLKDI